MPHWRELERLRPTFGLTFLRLPVARADELDAAFRTIVRERAEALFVFPSNRNIAERQRIAELSRTHQIPSVFEFAFHVEAGGLLAYGASFREFMGKTAPMYVDKILRGAKPAELPIVQPTRFELVVNVKTARALGITIPHGLLNRSDRVIE